MNMNYQEIEKGIEAWGVAGGFAIESQKVAFMASIFQGKMQELKIPFDALPKIISHAMAVYSKPTLPHFLKSWDSVRDEYWTIKAKSNEKSFDESKDQNSPIVGMNWERYLFYSECIRIRMQIPEMIQAYHPMRARQLELLKLAGGVPDVPSDKEDLVVRHWAESLPQGLRESIWRKWQSIVAPIRSRRFNDD
jgi:hypothetical protein